jgi:hypothetical protein
MISMETCIAMCGLEQDEVDSVIHELLVDDLHAAEAMGDHGHAAEITIVLQRFAREHTESGLLPMN